MLYKTGATIPRAPLGSARNPIGRRLALHGAICLGALGLGAVTLVWPQWLILDGSETSLAIQVSRERELSDRLLQVRALNQKLREWRREDRRVLLRNETPLFTSAMKNLAIRNGVRLVDASVSPRPSKGWRAAHLTRVDPDLTSTNEAGIEPRSIRLVLAGSFAQVFRTIASLPQEQWLLVIDAWDLIPAGKSPQGRLVKAAVQGTIFVASGDSVDSAAGSPLEVADASKGAP